MFKSWYCAKCKEKKGYLTSRKVELDIIKSKKEDVSNFRVCNKCGEVVKRVK